MPAGNYQQRCWKRAASGFSDAGHEALWAVWSQRTRWESLDPSLPRRLRGGTLIWPSGLIDCRCHLVLSAKKAWKDGHDLRVLICVGRRPLDHFLFLLTFDEMATRSLTCFSSKLLLLQVEDLARQAANLPLVSLSLLCSPLHFFSLSLDFLLQLAHGFGDMFKRVVSRANLPRTLKEVSDGCCQIEHWVEWRRGW